MMTTFSSIHPNRLLGKRAATQVASSGLPHKLRHQFVLVILQDIMFIFHVCDQMLLDVMNFYHFYFNLFILVTKVLLDGS